MMDTYQKMKIVPVSFIPVFCLHMTICQCIANVLPQAAPHLMHRTYALAQIFLLAKQAFFMAKLSNISQSHQHWS
jgi:hypothetical protein